MSYDPLNNIRENINNESENKLNKKIFFVSSVIPGFSINNKFLNSIITFCNTKKAKFVLLPMKGIDKNSYWNEDEWNTINKFLYTQYKFNNKLKAFDILLNPNQINPLTGLERYGQKDFSLIIASPKQQMKSVPVSNSLPHVLWTTGTICSNTNYTNNRIGKLAIQDHVLGGLIVEIEKDEFYIRPVQCLKNGSFVDLNSIYNQNKVIQSTSPLLYMGDSHAGWEDEKSLSSTLNQINTLNVKEIFIGDLFDGTSITHHHDSDINSQLQRPINLQTLESELHTVANYLKNFINQFPKIKINVIRSNHDEHLDRYLTERRFINDRLNYKISLQLSIYLIENKNPIEEWIKINYPKINKNINWLKRESSYKIKHIELACHGDKGSDGKWGSALNLEKSYGSCVVGHTHSPQILRSVYIVGTNSKLNLPYTKGSPSSWLHANCIIYHTGQRQLLITVNGKWKIN